MPNIVVNLQLDPQNKRNSWPSSNIEKDQITNLSGLLCSLIPLADADFENRVRSGVNSNE
jgi:hypothetical protein